MVYGVWYVVYGMWGVICVVWYVVCDVWRMVCGVWYVVYGMWHVVCDMWCMICCVWYVRCDMWHVACNMRACTPKKRELNVLLLYTFIYTIFIPKIQTNKTFNKPSFGQVSTPLDAHVLICGMRYEYVACGL